MKAFRTTTSDGPAGLCLADAPEPSHGPDELLVAVRATALNRADLLQTKGLYPAPAGAPRDIPGLEYAGEVLATGDRVTRWRPGDRIMGIVPGGAWAERLAVHQDEALPVPTALSFTDAAAVPEAFATAFDALVLQGALRYGSTVLVHAATSSVGLAAAQLCRALGARAIGTGRDAAKLERARALTGMDCVPVAREAPAFAATVRAQTGGAGCHLLLDLVGGSFAAESVEALAEGGTWLLLGLLGGASATLPLGRLLQRRLRLVGSTLRSRGLGERLALAGELRRTLVPLLEAGAVAPVVGAVVDPQGLVPALERMSRNELFGKVVVAW